MSVQDIYLGELVVHKALEDTEGTRYAIFQSLNSSDLEIIQTSNMTGRHQDPKQKLRPGYTVPSLQRTGWLLSTPLTRTSRCDAFSMSSVVSHAFSALCMYSKFGHHPHPLDYLCAKFCFFRGLHCWASPCRKSAYSITHPAYLMLREQKLSFQNM